MRNDRHIEAGKPKPLFSRYLDNRVLLIGAGIVLVYLGATGDTDYRLLADLLAESRGA